MSRHTQVARRYARALAATLGDAELDPMAEVLRALSRAASSSAALRAALASPAIPAARRSEIVLSLAKRLEAPARLTSFVQLLARKDRLTLLGEIAGEFETVRDERRGRVRAELRTARPLDPERRERIRRALARLTGLEVQVEERVEPELIGGVVARVGSTVWDGSVRRRLQGLREQILRTS